VYGYSYGSVTFSNHNITTVNKTKNFVKEREERHLWYCAWSMSPTTM